MACSFVDPKLDPEKRKQVYFILEMIAYLSRITTEEQAVIKNTLSRIASTSVNILNDFTPVVQHDKLREAQKGWEAEQAKK